MNENKLIERLTFEAIKKETLKACKQDRHSFSFIRVYKTKRVII